MKKYLLRIFCLLFTIYGFHEGESAVEKTIDHFTIYQTRTPQEKVYLHTDKDVYLVGETVWIRAHMADATTHLPDIISNYVYVELINTYDTLISRIKMIKIDSIFMGQIIIPKEIQQGDYSLQAYTFHMCNLDPSYMFRKKIRIINPQDSKVNTDIQFSQDGRTAHIRFTNIDGKPYALQNVCFNFKRPYDINENINRTDKEGNLKINIPSSANHLYINFEEDLPFTFSRSIRLPEKNENFDITFFPEGGNLLAGNIQTVAFKVIGTDGLPVEATCVVYMNNAQIVTTSTQHDGMGKFRIPVYKDENYRAIVTCNGIEKEFPLPPIKESGLGISLTSMDSLVITELLTTRNIPVRELFIAIHSRGELLHIKLLENKRDTIHLEELNPGINQFVLYNSQGEVISQRLFFKYPGNRYQISVSSGNKKYGKRQKIDLTIALSDILNEEVQGNFSLAVSEEKKFPEGIGNDHILSYMLLNSDLKGYISNPAYYFDESLREREDFVDLLMLTHGWTRFDVSGLLRGIFPEYKYPYEIGQVIAGKVVGNTKKRNVNVPVNYITKEGRYGNTITDENGNFIFDNISFREKTAFTMIARSNKGKSNVSLHIEPEEFAPHKYSFPYGFPLFEEEKAFYQANKQDYYFEDGIRMLVLDEVNITSRKTGNAVFFENFSRAHADSTDLARYDVKSIHHLPFVIPGLHIGFDSITDNFGDTIYAQCFKYNGKAIPLILNGWKEWDIGMVEIIPIKAIKHVAIIYERHAYAYAGIVSDILVIETDPFTPIGRADRSTHRVIFEPLGYQIPEEFYVPKYEVDSVRRDNRYDERSTIYWQPSVKLKSGEPQKISFYTSDTPGTYKIILEGITRQGTPIRKESEIEIE